MNCYINGTSCTSITNITTECEKIFGGALTDTICAAYHPGCTVNSEGSAC